MPAEAGPAAHSRGMSSAGAEDAQHRPESGQAPRGKPAHSAPAQVSTKTLKSQRNKGKNRKKSFKEGNSQVLSFIHGHNYSPWAAPGTRAQ